MRPAPFAFKVSVAVLMAVIAAVNTKAEVDTIIQQVCVALFAYSVASVIFPWGWAVPCIVIGALISVMMDKPIKGGSMESQMWETIGRIWLGVFSGFVVGLILDRFTPDVLRCDLTSDGTPVPSVWNGAL